MSSKAYSFVSLLSGFQPFFYSKILRKSFSVRVKLNEDFGSEIAPELVSFELNAIPRT